MPGIPIGWPCIVGDVRVEETFLAQHISKDLFEATERLRLKRQTQPQVRAISSKPFANSGKLDLFGTDDLYTCNDVVAFHRQAMNASQLTILLAAQRD
jgi:hypothetical protein